MVNVEAAADEEEEVNLDPVLLEILVCPDCKGSLTVDSDHDELVCSSCGLSYPVRDNIPIMLVDEARRPAPPTAGSGEAESSGSGVAEDAADARAGRDS